LNARDGYKTRENALRAAAKYRDLCRAKLSETGGNDA
tara:strand:+ start:511 stop:621 length:111 start_codon:yes stop_codon:yes gene_type:complete